MWSWIRCVAGGASTRSLALSTRLAARPLSSHSFTLMALSVGHLPPLACSTDRLTMMLWSVREVGILFGMTLSLCIPYLPSLIVKVNISVSFSILMSVEL
jgi:hypothetical protein